MSSTRAAERSFGGPMMLASSCPTRLLGFEQMGHS
jgi:hypothetical protein